MDGIVLGVGSDVADRCATKEAETQHFTFDSIQVSVRGDHDIVSSRQLCQSKLISVGTVITFVQQIKALFPQRFLSELAVKPLFIVTLPIPDLAGVSVLNVFIRNAVDPDLQPWDVFIADQHFDRSVGDHQIFPTDAQLPAVDGVIQRAACSGPIAGREAFHRILTDLRGRFEVPAMLLRQLGLERSGQTLIQQSQPIRCQSAGRIGGIILQEQAQSLFIERGLVCQRRFTIYEAQPVQIGFHASRGIGIRQMETDQVLEQIDGQIVERQRVWAVNAHRGKTGGGAKVAGFIEFKLIGRTSEAGFVVDVKIQGPPGQKVVESGPQLLFIGSSLVDNGRIIPNADLLQVLRPL